MLRLFLFADNEPCQEVAWDVKPEKDEVVYYKSLRHRVEEVVHDIDANAIKVFMYKTEQAKADGVTNQINKQ